ncbi:mitochondrial inner-membrane-bound regulator-domain-containing protein [Lipomyces oligophaga]|uniref:mitochondrial inner-membrane-bound regulator-domain-containing protein n=1 Tax=Lipomyces oligophaga TaxID=45792 RepID=UPI0034CF9D8C
MLSARAYSNKTTLVCNYNCSFSACRHYKLVHYGRSLHSSSGEQATSTTTPVESPPVSTSAPKLRLASFLRGSGLDDRSLEVEQKGRPSWPFPIEQPFGHTQLSSSLPSKSTKESTSQTNDSSHHNPRQRSSAQGLLDILQEYKKSTDTDDVQHVSSSPFDHNNSHSTTQLSEYFASIEESIHSVEHKSGMPDNSKSSLNEAAPFQGTANIVSSFLRKVDNSADTAGFSDSVVADQSLLDSPQTFDPTIYASDPLMINQIFTPSILKQVDFNVIPQVLPSQFQPIIVLDQNALDDLESRRNAPQADAIPTDAEVSSSIVQHSSSSIKPLVSSSSETTGLDINSISTDLLADLGMEAPIFDQIESVRPSKGNLISKVRYVKLNKKLSSMVLKSQLISYCQSKHKLLNIKSTSSLRSMKKSELIEYTLKTLWNLKVSNKVDEAVLFQITYPLGTTELALLETRGGLILRTLERKGLSFSVNTETQTSISIVGEKTVVEYAVASLNHILSAVQMLKLELNLGPDLDKLPLKQIGYLCSSHLVPDTKSKSVTISALRMSDIDRTIRLLIKTSVSKSNFNGTNSTQILYPVTPTNDSYFTPLSSAQLESLPWYKSETDWVRWQTVSKSYTDQGGPLLMSPRMVFDGYLEQVNSYVSELRLNKMKTLDAGQVGYLKTLLGMGSVQTGELRSSDDDGGVKEANSQYLTSLDANVDQSVSTIEKHMLNANLSLNIFDGQHVNNDSNGIVYYARFGIGLHDRSSQETDVGEIPSQFMFFEHAPGIKMLIQNFFTSTASASAEPSFSNLNGAGIEETGLGLSQRLESEISISNPLILSKTDSHISNSVNSFETKDNKISLEEFPRDSNSMSFEVETENSSDSDHSFESRPSIIWSKDQVTTQRLYRLKLIASPSLNPKTFNKLPILELDVIANESWTADVASCVLRARSAEVQKQSLLLPSSVTDIQFVREQQQQISVEQPGIKEFVENLKLDPAGSNNGLWVDREVNIHLGGGDEDKPVTYMFLSIEQRTSAEYRYLDRYILEYSRVDAGALDGQRDEVTIRLADNVERVDELVDAAVQVAYGSTLVQKSLAGFKSKDQGFKH